jgi:hypothetical protein
MKYTVEMDSSAMIYIQSFMKIGTGVQAILWHADLLLGKNHEINNYTTPVTRQQPINNNGGTVFSVWSVLRCK